MQTLSNWHNKANQGKLIGTEQYEPDLMTALQEIKQLKRQLKVAEDQQIFSITRMCHVLRVKPSSYYDWLNRDISDQQIRRNQSELLVKAAHSETRERYGIERLHAHLSEQGHNISPYMVRRIFDEYSIKDAS